MVISSKMKSMKVRAFKKKLLVSGICTFICFSGYWLVSDIDGFVAYKEIKLLLLERLTKIKPLPEKFYDHSSETNNVLYVLGSSERSLSGKFKAAAELYHVGRCKKILILSREGITRYDPLLSRNLTNDEWAVNQLMKFGVEEKDIEPVAIKRGFFGTLTEAKDISDIALRRGYKNLILVTSLSHTMRTWLSFSKFLRDKGTTLYIYGSNDSISLSNLLIEYIKYFIYKAFVLPIYHND